MRQRRCAYSTTVDGECTAVRFMRMSVKAKGRPIAKAREKIGLGKFSMGAAYMNQRNKFPVTEESDSNSTVRLLKNQREFYWCPSVRSSGYGRMIRTSDCKNTSDITKS